MHKMSGFTAWELVEKCGPNTSTYFLEELDGIIGKRFLFRAKFSEYNHNNNSHVYRCEGLQMMRKLLLFGNKDSEENIKEDMEDEMTTPAAPIKSAKVLDLNLTRRLQLQTPTSDCIGSSSGHTSGSEKKHQRTIKRSIVVIDLLDSEYDTEDDEKESNAKKTYVGCGSLVVPTGRYVVPAGRVVVHTGMYVVPAGRVVVPTGRYVVPTGRVVVPTGRYVVPAGRVVVPTD
nr:hypothetical protein [Tanacetum cinerariifolium]